MSIDPAAYEKQRALMQSQVRNLVSKYGDRNAKALAVIPKADSLYKMRIQAGYDTPSEARMWVVRTIARQLSGKPATYQNIADANFALGDQSYVPKAAEARQEDVPAGDQPAGPVVIDHPAYSMASPLTARLSRDGE